MIRFRLPGYQQLTKALDADLLQLDVVLRQVESVWRLPPCSPLDILKRIGWGMKISVPDNAVVRTISGEDSIVNEIVLERGMNSEKMTIGAGHLWWIGLPGKDQIQSSLLLQERTMACHSGADYRGRDKGGWRWRYTGWANETIVYGKVSDRTADLFDSIIDSLCCNPVH